jgi:hypothetical protein
LTDNRNLYLVATGRKLVDITNEVLIEAIEVFDLLLILDYPDGDATTERMYWC